MEACLLIHSSSLPLPNFWLLVVAAALIYNDTVLLAYNFSSLRHLNLSGQLDQFAAANSEALAQVPAQAPAQAPVSSFSFDPYTMGTNAGLNVSFFNTSQLPGLSQGSLRNFNTSSLQNLSSLPVNTSSLDPALLAALATMPNFNGSQLVPLAAVLAAAGANVSQINRYAAGPFALTAPLHQPDLGGHGWQPPTTGCANPVQIPVKALLPWRTSGVLRQVEAALQASSVLQTDSGMGLRAALTIMHNTSRSGAE